MDLERRVLRQRARVVAARRQLPHAGLDRVLVDHRPSSAAALSRRTACATSSRQLEPVELGQARLGVEHRVVGPEAELPAQPPRDLALDLVGQVAVLPAADVEIDVGLVQRHGDGLEVPRPADVGEHDLHLRVPGGDAVEQDRPGEVDPQALTARLAGAEPARARVREQRSARARRRRRRTAGSDRRRGRTPASWGAASARAAPAPGSAPAARARPRGSGRRDPNPTNRPLSRQIRAISALSSSLPPASHPSSTPTRSSRSYSATRSSTDVRLRPRPEVPLDRVRVVPDAPAHPVAGRQMDVHVDSSHRRRYATLTGILIFQMPVPAEKRRSSATCSATGRTRRSGTRSSTGRSRPGSGCATRS